MPFLGANRTALIAGWGPQGPDYKSKITFPMVMGLEPTGVMPKYSAQEDRFDSGFTNNNFFDAYTAPTIDTTDRASWDPDQWTEIWCVRFPTGFFAARGGEFGNEGVQISSNLWYAGGSDTEWSNTWFMKNTGSEDPEGARIRFEHNEPGVFTQTNVGGDYGTVLAASLEGIWLSICMSRAPYADFQNYNPAAINEGDLFGCRVYIRNAVTGALLYNYDMPTFDPSQAPPDITSYSTLTVGDSNPSGNDWRYDGWNFGGDGGFTGVIDHAQTWISYGGFVDPATTDVWVGNGIPTTINGVTAWIHATYTDIFVSSQTFISTSPTNLASQANDKIFRMAAPFDGYTNTIYPGS